MGLRSLVKGMNMGDALLFTVSKDQMPAYDVRVKTVVTKIKEEADQKQADDEKAAHGEFHSPRAHPSVTIDLTEEPLR